MSFKRSSISKILLPTSLQRAVTDSGNPYGGRVKKSQHFPRQHARFLSRQRARIGGFTMGKICDAYADSELCHDASSRTQWPIKRLEEVVVSSDLLMDIDFLREEYDLVHEFVQYKQTRLPNGKIPSVTCLCRSCEQQVFLSETERRHFYNDAKPQ
jgi:hypothetical protein